MKLFKLFGVKVKVSPYLLAFMALYVGLGVWPQALAVFVLVFTHEWFHILVARGFAVEVSSVELFPFGGVARLSGLFETDPTVETLVALAGPASNLLMALAGFIVGKTGWLEPDLVSFFISTNLTVAAFNLLPALPLDGGRVLRAWLTTRAGYRSATNQAAKAGRVTGIILACAGIILLLLRGGDILVPAVGIFVFLAAKKEEKDAQFVFLRYLNRKKEELAKLGILRTHTLAVRPEQPVKDVVRQILPQRYMIVHVIDENFRISQSLTETEVIRTLFEKGIDYPVGKVS